VKQIKKIVFCLISLLTFIFWVPFVFAQSPSPPNQLSDLNGIFKIIINSITTIAILIFFIMMLLGGFRFLFSGGDAKAVEKARDTLMHAVIGLVVLILIWFLLLAVEAVTGVEVTNFYIGIPGKP